MASEPLHKQNVKEFISPFLKVNIHSHCDHTYKLTNTLLSYFNVPSTGIFWSLHSDSEFSSV